MTAPRERPVRIQRKRTKGWRMPEGVVYVGRPSQWGNPFSGSWYLRYHFDMRRSLELYRQLASGSWNPRLTEGLMDGARAAVYNDHTLWLQRMQRHPVDVIRAELRGKDLACWCAVGSPCHGDILLEIANE